MESLTNAEFNEFIIVALRTEDINASVALLSKECGSTFARRSSLDRTCSGNSARPHRVVPLGRRRSVHGKGPSSEERCVGKTPGCLARRASQRRRVSVQMAASVSEDLCAGESPAYPPPSTRRLRTSVQIAGSMSEKLCASKADAPVCPRIADEAPQVEIDMAPLESDNVLKVCPKGLRRASMTRRKSVTAAAISEKLCTDEAPHDPSSTEQVETDMAPLESDNSKGPRRQSMRRRTLKAKGLSDPSGQRMQLFTFLDVDGSADITLEEWLEAFDRIDENRSGSVSRREWNEKKGINDLFDAISKKYSVNLTRMEWRKAFEALDADGDGVVSAVEWLEKCDGKIFQASKVEVNKMVPLVSDNVPKAPCEKIAETKVEFDIVSLRSDKDLGMTAQQVEFDIVALRADKDASVEWLDMGCTSSTEWQSLSMKSKASAPTGGRKPLRTLGLRGLRQRRETFKNA